MPSVSLTKRLSAIFDLIENGSVVSDIGTDHAFLPIKLIESGKCKKVIASDIVDGPLMSAKKNITAHNIFEGIELVKSDGLENVVKFSPDTIVIAGMGGETISDILNASDYPQKSGATLILQPMTHAEVLRNYLFENSFEICDEIVVREDNRFYIIIVSRYLTLHENLALQSDTLCKNAELGTIIKTSKQCGEEYLLWRKSVTERTLNQLKSSNNNSQKEYFTDLLNDIEQRLK